MKKSKLSLKWLDVFLMTARSGAVQDAAEQADLSVSTVSHHLRSLEETLGVTLFDHSRRPMRLTTAGVVFYGHVEEALRILRRAEAEVQSGSLEDTRTMALALIEDFDSEIGPELARSLAAGMPNCSFRHVTRNSNDILNMLRSHEIDIGITAVPQFAPEDLVETPLLRDPFVLAIPATSKTAPEDFIDGHSGLPLLRYASDQVIADQIEAQLRRMRLNLPKRFEFDSNQSLMNLVAEGDGWAITTPLNYIRAKRFHRQIKLAPFPGKAFSRAISIFTTETTTPSALSTVNGTMRRLLNDRAVRPTVERMPWLSELFKVVPDQG